MDEMKITSAFTRNIVSKIIKKSIKKKAGYDVDIQLSELSSTIIDGKAHVHLDIDAELNKEELTKILKTIGLF